jgi:hypothetical protein
MPSDLEGNLIEGGLSPAAAKLISNAIDNAATNRLSTGRQLEDTTPADRMRLIDANTRRYVLTNLDYPSAANPNQYQPAAKPHPYQDSQPATANPTISTPGVKGGAFVSVATATTNEVAQAEVSLNIKPMGGQHARMNHATGQIEAVPIRIVCEPQNRLEATVEEQADATVIRLRFLQ